MGSHAPVRQRVVDDADPAISYGAQGWFVADPTLTAGNFGPIFNGTTHGTTSNNSTLTFPFNGTSIEVWGTIAVTTANNVTDPSWDCFIDEIKIANDPTFQFQENNWPLCTQATIAPGAHTLKIQVHSTGHPFYFDYLKYTPLPEDTFNSAILVYSSTDPSVRYSSGWVTFGGENATDVKGAQVTLNFHGTSVSMYGFVPTERPHNATWAMWTMDDSPPVNFTLRGLSDGNTQYNVILFTTPTLDSAVHNLVVTYGGDSQHTPLVLQGFYVTNTTETLSLASSNSSASASSSNSAPSSSLSSTPSKSAPVGAIVGGVIAGFFTLVVLAIVACFFQRKRRWKSTGSSPVSPTPFHMTMADPEAVAASPYTYTNSHGPRSDNSRPSTNYPSVQYADSLSAISPLHQHPSETMSSSHSHGASTHARQPSAVSSSADSSGAARSISANVSHSHSRPPASIPLPSGVGSKLSREVAASGSRRPGANSAVVVLQHEDSGVRLRSPLEPQAVEVPPGYSLE
ncbi:hypothetical protein C8F01DRAFT_1259996 [Mycena amicta]|nr:hypothetical protein C8F01DRAFT_1259996 [Mycena amicta]